MYHVTNFTFELLNIRTKRLTHEYPVGCSDPNSSIECIRGNPTAATALWAVASTVIFSSICYVGITMYMVYRYMRNIEKRAESFTFSFHTSSRKQERERSKKIMKQGILYGLALFLVFFFSSLHFFENLIFGEWAVSIFGLDILTAIFTPLQGLFNAFIYSISASEAKSKRREARKNVSPSNSSKKERACNEISVTFGCDGRMDNEMGISREDIEHIDTEETKEELQPNVCIFQPRR